MNALTIVIVLALISTIVVLFIGLGSMARGGEYDENHADQLMITRVGLQGVTLVLLFLALYLANG